MQSAQPGSSWKHKSLCRHTVEKVEWQIAQRSQNPERWLLYFLV